jgi:hypothetical protein
MIVQAQGTYYGQQAGQDDAADCSFGKNFANTLGASWKTGVQTFAAMNRDQYNNSKACGQCIMYRCCLILHLGSLARNLAVSSFACGALCCELRLELSITEAL